MFDIDNIPEDDLKRAKRKLNITWSDEDTDLKVEELMVDAEIWLNHKLGAEMDYSSPGAARQLYLNLLLYMWNDSADQFESAYKSEILALRHVNEVAAYLEEQETEEESDD